MNSGRKKILWLASWYPNKFDRYDGDFIQRHARAASLYNDIHVIVVKEGDIEKDVEEEWNYATGLTEQVIYYKTSSGIFSKLRKQLTWRKLFLHAVAKYIEENGRPAIVHVHVPWKAGLVALELRKRFKIDFITSEHWGIYDQTIKDNFLSRPVLFRRLTYWIFKNTQLLCVPSKYLGVCINNAVLQKKYVLIPNVVDTTLFFYQQKKYSKFTLIHVSNMEEIKNVTGIIDAFFELVFVKGHNELELILVGNRDDSLKRYAQNKGLLNKYIFFKGEIPYAEVARELQLAHCFILNSKMETFSCVTAESLCCGLPVVARNVGSLPELINATNGILIYNDHSLTDALLQIIENYHKYDQNQIAYEAQQRYNYGIIGDLFRRLYDSL